MEKSKEQEVLDHQDRRNQAADLVHEALKRQGWLGVQPGEREDDIAPLAKDLMAFLLWMKKQGFIIGHMEDFADSAVEYTGE